jgi:hypothetical protein
VRRQLAAALLLGSLARPAAAQGSAAAPAADAPTTSASPAAPAELALESYRAALTQIERQLAVGEAEEAVRAAGALRGARVTDGRERFEADPSVLLAVAQARDRASVLAARARLRALIDSLEPGEPGRPSETDAQRLARLAREEAGRRPGAGGQIDASLELGPSSARDQLRDWLAAAARWLWDKIVRLFEWLTRVASRDQAKGGTTGAVGVLVAAVAVLLAVATVFSLRRRDPGEALGEAELAPSKGDEDPLSRESTEWERYAAELAEAGRRREAVRAWYHAVLVALFRAGQLHHQRGRTNWEYVSQVGPEAVWRPAFIRLTETFDREWYGRQASAPETLREHVARARDVLRAVRAGEAAA